MKRFFKFSVCIAILVGMPVMWLVYLQESADPMVADIYRCVEKGDAEGPIKSYGTNVLPTYIRILSQGSSKGIPEPWTVFRSLEKLGCDAAPAMPSVLKFLKRERYSAWMAEKFCKIQCDEFKKVWISTLKSDDPKMQNFAARFVAPYGKEAQAAIPDLEAMMQKGSATAAQAIVSIDPYNKGLIRTLTSLAKGPGTPFRKRAEYIGIIADLKVRNLEASSALVPLLQFRIEKESIGSTLPARSSLFQQTDFTNDDWQRLVLAAIGQVATTNGNNIDVLLPFLESTNLALKLYAANAIWKSSQEATHTLPALKKILESPKEKVIKYSPDQSDLFKYSDHLIRFQRPIDINSWAAAANILGQMGSSSIVTLPLLEKRSRESTDWDKVFLTQAIYSLTSNPDSYLAALEEILSAPISQGGYASSHIEAIRLARQIKPLPPYFEEGLKKLPSGLGFWEAAKGPKQ